ncbi:peptidase M16 [Lysobacteraceae bacterium NML75-0749]|nr:peptidase M16 [Xanthomonadaceae bacterium NML75-0749]PJK05025.1 peptidase M16 [Xanthomonadaceae bacterium NML91-0268]
MMFKSAPRMAALSLALATALGGSFVPAPAQAARSATQVNLPYETFTLPNGLRVVVHTDRKAPIVAVNVWYHVGSKDEPAGRTGFAHLFEHLMFNGSENHPGEYFAPFEQAGATDMNGTTNSDRTNYFQNVPTTALDMALWMESDRMGHLLGAIDQKTLDEQRGVVQNEKRQGENRPYGQFYATMLRTMYPKGHPYHHTVIGSMNDLNAATLDDVKNWFRAWYGPNNAVLVLAGDIDVATAREKVTKYFGHIPAGPSLAQPAVNVPKMNVSGRTEMQDKVPQTLLARVWHVPQSTSSESDVLDLFSEVLGGSTTSRLDRRLVYQDQLVDSISTSNMGSQLAGLFMVQAMVKPGVDVAKVEAAIDEELQKLLREGPSAEELARAKTDHNASLVRGMERIGGFGGKADILASCTIYTGKPGCLDESQRNIAAATPASVQQTAQRWLAAPSHTFVITPGERTALTEDLSVQPAPFNLPAPDRKYRTTAAQVDRSQGVPQVTDFPALKFPALQRAKLANGTTVVLAERHDIPVVQMSYQFHGGYASDAGGKLGRASFAMGMLDEGAGELDALAFKARAESLGAQLGAGANLDGSSVSLSALKSNLDASLALYADMLRRPAFNAADIERVRAQWLAGIAQEKANPGSVAQRVLPPLLYDEGHPYAIPFTGSGTEDAIKALSRDDLLAYQKTWLRPEAATLLVVGDTTLEEIVPLLNKHLGDWKGEGAVAQPVALPQVDAPRQARVYLIDQPGAIQANIMVGKLVPSSRDAGATRLEMSNDIIGGTFTSRLNMNLREDKHWSYGARTSLVSALGQRPWLASAPVQIDKTAESLAEIRREFAEYASGKAPARQEEVTKVVNNELRSQPGAYETGRAVMSTINGIVRYGRPDNWVTLRNAEVEAFSVADANTAAASFNPDNLVWVVVGDLGKIEAPVRALNLGEVTILDADGKPVAAKK